MKTRFILNPVSGRNVRRPWLARHVRDFIATRGLTADLVLTECPGHATRLAQAALAAGCDRVIAIGGDGTMNETAQALLHSPAALGLVPCGSGNGLALHLGIPTRLPEALALAADPAARVAAIDTGTVNGRPFFNAMGFGFDAEVSRRFNLLTRRGLPAYVKTTCAALFGYRPETYHIRNGTAELTTPAFIVTVANSDQYGNDCFIAPGARVDDGRLDLTVIKRANAFNTLPLVARLFSKRIDGSPSVARLQGAHFTIERAAPGLIHTDGETHETGALVDIVVRPRSLRIMVPAQVPPPA